MILEQTIQQLATLNLIGMKQALQQQIDQPKTFDLSFEERLGLLVDCEKIHRQNKKVERLLTAAHLRHTATLETLDYQPDRNLKREQVSQLATGEWIRQGYNLVITGPTGIGKSWIACALGHQACRQEYSVLYTRLSLLLEDLRLAQAQGTYRKRLAKLKALSLLILDDWGLDRLNTEQRRMMLDLVEERHPQQSTLITSQLPVNTWYEVIGDPTIADAILDRLLSKTHNLTLKGDSLRQKSPLK
jgi:DNA replication protein DnaC